MSALVAAEASHVDGLSSRIAREVFLQQLIQDPKGKVIAVTIVLCFGDTEPDRGDDFLGRQKAVGTVVFIPILVKDDQARCLYDLEGISERLVVVRQAQRNCLAMNEIYHLGG